MKFRWRASLWIVAAFLFVIGDCMRAGPADSAQVFTRLVGKWTTAVSYTHPVNQWEAYRSEDVQIKQLDPNTIVFSSKPKLPPGPVFDAVLTYVEETKKFFLSVKSDGRETLEKTELSYDASSGFSGKGILRDIEEKPHPVEVTIKFKDSGSHEWKISYVTNPGKSDEAFAFLFAKRVD